MQMRRFKSAVLLVQGGCLALFLSSAARADDLPQGTAPVAPASKGSTELTAQKFEAAAAIADAAQAKDATELSMGAGGLASSGNSRLVALTANGQFRLRRSDNQLTAASAANYSRSAAPGEPLATTVGNVQAKTRYDRFFLVDWTAFFGVQARNDKFQGLDLRLQLDPGLGYYFVNQPKQLLWAELGYDYLHDIRRDEDRIVRNAAGDATGQVLSKANTVHSGRAFVGYEDQLNDAVTLALSVEFLQGLSTLKTRRLNNDLKVSSKLGGGLSLATSFSVRYDSVPLPGKETVDMVTAINLIFKLL